MVHNVLESIALLADASLAFERYCAAGIEPDRARIREHLERNLMLVTALNPHIGYDAAARIAKHALARGMTLRAAALELGLVTPEQFDAWMDPMAMAKPHQDRSTL